MDLEHRMRCSMSPSEPPSRSLATDRAVGYSFVHGDTVRMLQPLHVRCHGRIHDRRSVGLREDDTNAGVAEACCRWCAIRAVGAGSQEGGAGGVL